MFLFAEHIPVNHIPVNIEYRFASVNPFHLAGIDVNESRHGCAWGHKCATLGRGAMDVVPEIFRILRQGTGFTGGEYPFSYLYDSRRGFADISEPNNNPGNMIFNKRRRGFWISDDPSTFRINYSSRTFQSSIGALFGSIGSSNIGYRLNNQKSKADDGNANPDNRRSEIPSIQFVRGGIILLLLIGGSFFFYGFLPEWAWTWDCGWRGQCWRWFGLCLLCIGWFFGTVYLFGRWFGSPILGPMDEWERHKQHEYRKQSFKHGINVTQKLLTSNNYCITVIHMANALNTDKQIAVIGALAEGSSIRSIERITGVHRDTIMRLGVKVGKGCAALMDAKMRELPCRYLEFDEIWGFIGKKEKHVTVDDSPELGDVWTFCAVDAETKLVPTFRCGKRDRATANAFVQDVASRMKNRVQISTDGLRAYVEAIEKSFGADVDYAQIVKTYTHDVEIQPNRRYSAPEIVSTEKKIFSGAPDISRISTSYVERLNATTRLHMRRLTRLTLAFSKKRENFEAAVALHFAYYNFVKIHKTLRCTPAMAAGVEQSLLSVSDLLEATAS